MKKNTNKNKNFTFLLLLVIAFTFVSYEASANDCPRYRFAKKYLPRLSNLSISSGSFDEAVVKKKNKHNPNIIIVKRLTSDQYLFTAVGPDPGEFLVTEQCGHVSWRMNSSENRPGTLLSHSDCDGFLQHNRIIKATCAITFDEPIDVTSHPELSNLLFSVKYIPVR